MQPDFKVQNAVMQTGNKPFLSGGILYLYKIEIVSWLIMKQQFKGRECFKWTEILLKKQVDCVEEASKTLINIMGRWIILKLYDK